ncbi:MAG: protein-disulfide reductase DsbD family protein, partial [Alphaproteobacteria bacterium]|nr:protein-disulfide reductase DsbD family protein [Alphaproteobacteria bacterium]
MSNSTVSGDFAGFGAFGRVLGTMMAKPGKFGSALLFAALFGLLASSGVARLDRAVAQPAQPGASEWSVGEKGRARLVSTVTGVGDLASLQLGLEVLVDEGWKTYWRSPGDAGLPPHIDWSGSTNLTEAALAYPAPKRFNYYEFETFGYADRVIYPIEVIPHTPGVPVILHAELDILICDDVCIPHEMTMSLNLPAGQARPSEFVDQIDRFVARVPGDGSNAGLGIEDAILAGTEEAPILQVAFNAETPFVAPDMLVEGPEFVTFSRPRVELTEDAKRILVTVTA